ncbi:MAG: hypothetical protein HY673_21540 [Chloroflexi bacterium]|nr:hypothetical protein [Chloroflexota bacterium]
MKDENRRALSAPAAVGLLRPGEITVSLTGRRAPPAGTEGRAGLRPAEQRARRELAGYQRLIAPAIAYRVHPVRSAGPEGIVLESGDVLAGPCPEPLASAQQIAASVGTIGPALETEVARLFKEKEALKAVLLDGLGNEALEATVLKAVKLIRRLAARQGHGASCAIMPGSGRLPLSEQETVFRLAGGEDIGVHLTGSGMMSPLKSVSMIVAIGPGIHAIASTTLCRTCTMFATCRYRKQVKNK